MTTHLPRKISVLIVDDHPPLRAGVRAMLEKTPDIHVIGEAGNGEEAEKLLDELRPNIILLDLKMPGFSPSAFEKWARENYPETITLVLTAHDRDAYLAQMMDAGAVGYLDKEMRAEQLIDGIRRAAGGEILFDQAQFARVAHWREEIREKLDQLTPREHGMLELLKNGLDNKSIAQNLNISVKTTMYHMTNLFRKLQVKNRQEATIWALKYLSDDPDIYPS